MTLVLQRKIYEKLAWLNELPHEEAVYVFKEASGSAEWSEAMASSRPFVMLEPLYARAESLWRQEDFARVEAGLNALLER